MARFALSIFYRFDYVNGHVDKNPDYFRFTDARRAHVFYTKVVDCVSIVARESRAAKGILFN